MKDVFEIVNEGDVEGVVLDTGKLDVLGTSRLEDEKFDKLEEELLEEVREAKDEEFERDELDGMDVVLYSSNTEEPPHNSIVLPEQTAVFKEELAVERLVELIKLLQ